MKLIEVVFKGKRNSHQIGQFQQITVCERNKVHLAFGNGVHQVMYSIPCKDEPEANRVSNYLTWTIQKAWSQQRPSVNLDTCIEVSSEAVVGGVVIFDEPKHLGKSIWQQMAEEAKKHNHPIAGSAAQGEVCFEDGIVRWFTYKGGPKLFASNQEKSAFQMGYKHPGFGIADELIKAMVSDCMHCECPLCTTRRSSSAPFSEELMKWFFTKGQERAIKEGKPKPPVGTGEELIATPEGIEPTGKKVLFPGPIYASLPFGFDNPMSGFDPESYSSNEHAKESPLTPEFILFVLGPSITYRSPNGNRLKVRHKDDFRRRAESRGEIDPNEEVLDLERMCRIGHTKGQFLENARNAVEKINDPEK